MVDNEAIALIYFSKTKCSCVESVCLCVRVVLYGYHTVWGYRKRSEENRGSPGAVVLNLPDDETL